METGPLLAAISVGMLIGDLVIGPAFTPATRERLVLPLLLVMGAPSIALILDPPYPAVLAVYVITGMGSAYLLGLQRRFLEVVPSELQGQGFALLNTTTMTIQGVGAQHVPGAGQVCPAGGGADCDGCRGGLVRGWAGAQGGGANGLVGLVSETAVSDAAGEVSVHSRRCGCRDHRQWRKGRAGPVGIGRRPECAAMVLFRGKRWEGFTSVLGPRGIRSQRLRGGLRTKVATSRRVCGIASI
ncbi:hypothetical protein CDG81_13285 [Actinopolyspora erythraea]|uniref:Major facilitator superfamily (MFS) profile domain-containing protein n=1 Tax=Actinopolyspora erythraea TaxID=414996 RepID=A0A099D333_9ACTN|nr:hypothetical protein [Actinopolyspora erythraea]ASU79098.1 hypothetical protein CDG81_13285 [Actinopolyspora erythraea]KGI80563.1 hypothetical protein IL38_16515 [Actinopolyspora erythraea]